MLFRNSGPDNQNQAPGWQELGYGAPTILGFALLCSQAISVPDPRSNEDLIEALSNEAKTIMVAASQRGSMDIRASREAFDSAERFLAVCVESDLDRWLLFLQKTNPEQTVRFLEGFRQLCQTGLVLHHLQKDFSLSARGFEIARLLSGQEFDDLIGFATEIEH